MWPLITAPTACTLVQNVPDTPLQGLGYKALQEESVNEKFHAISLWV